jgi:hypothetical protein
LGKRVRDIVEPIPVLQYKPVLVSMHTQPLLMGAKSHNVVRRGILGAVEARRSALF